MERPHATTAAAAAWIEASVSPSSERARASHPYHCDSVAVGARAAAGLAAHAQRVLEPRGRRPRELRLERRRADDGGEPAFQVFFAFQSATASVSSFSASASRPSPWSTAHPSTR